MNWHMTHDFARTLRWFLCILIIGALLWYMFVQARPFIEGPRLTLRVSAAAPNGGRVVVLSGTARTVAALSLNDRPIFTDEGGAWSERLVLENGYTILTLRARDRFGRSALIERALVYKPAYEQAVTKNMGTKN